MKGRRIAWISAVGALAVCLSGAWILRERIQEEWWIRQLGSKDEATVVRALERLGELRSVRAVPGLVEMYKRHEEGIQSVGKSLVKTVIETATKTGPGGLSAIIEGSAWPAPDGLEDVLAERWDSNLPVLLECAKDERDHVMSISARSLRKIDDEKAWPSLLLALENPSERVRFAAAWALALSHVRLKAVRELMVASLTHSTSVVRIEAANAIDSYTRNSAFRELARLCAPALVDALRDRERDVRESAANALGFSGCEEAVPALLEAFDDPDAGVSGTAVTAISNLGCPSESTSYLRAQVPRVISNFRGSDPKAVRHAAQVLTSLGRDARAVWPELLEHWRAQLTERHSYGYIRYFSTVQRMGPGAAAAVPTLIAQLGVRAGEDGHPVRALQAIGPEARAAIPRLLELLKKLGDYPTDSLQHALPAICPDGDEVLPELLRIVGDRQQLESIRSQATKTLGGFRRREEVVLPTLLSILGDEKAGKILRSAAAEGLGRLGRTARDAAPAIDAASKGQGLYGDVAADALWRVDPRYMPRTVHYFKTRLERNKDTQDFANSLADIGSPASDAVPELIRHLKLGRFGTYTVSAGEALFRIGKPAVPALADALRSDDVAVRSQAAEILGWIGPAAEEAIPQLTSALSDEDAEVRRDAAKALPMVSALRDLHRLPKLQPDQTPKLSPLLLAADGSAITSAEGWAKRRAELRAAWLAFLGGPPEERGSLELQILETEEPTKYTRRLVRYRIEDGVSADAYLLTPWDLIEDGSRKAPAVVVFHSTVDSHSGEPAGLDAYRSELAIGVHLVERGFVAVCPRCFIFDDGADYAGNVAKMQVKNPERKGMARMLLDGVRAADLLESLPYVDRDRLGCIGHSLGAKEALYAAAFDERFRAAVFHEGGIGLAMSNWDAPWYLGSQIREPGVPRDHHELLALVAPRSFLLIAGGEADDERSGAYVEAALGVHKLLGAESRFGWVLHTGGHNYTRFARATAEEFLERGLR